MKPNYNLKIKISICCLLFFAVFAQGQIDKKTFKIGTALSIDNNDNTIEVERSPYIYTNEFEFNRINLQLHCSYFVENNFAIGLNVEYLNEKYTEMFSEYEEDIDRIIFGPQISYYVKLSENLYLPLYAQVGLCNQSEKYEEGFYDELLFKGKVYDFGGGLEYVYKNKVGLRFDLKYRIKNLISDDMDKIDFKNKNIFGVVSANFYFRKKKEALDIIEND